MEGLVLQKIDYGETDQIIRIFLKEGGQVSGIAKGIKRSKRRFPHKLEPFRIYNFRFRKKPSQRLYFIESADQLRDFEPIIRDIRKIAIGNFILELLLTAVKENSSHPELYAYVLSFFDILGISENLLPLWLHGGLHVMAHLGFAPNFERCVKCHAPLRVKEVNHFSPRRGGIVCPRCSPASHFLPVSPQTLRILQFLIHSPLQTVTRIILPSHARKEIESFLVPFLTYHLERPLLTLPLLQESLE